MKKLRTLKQKIIFYVMVVSIFLAVSITLVMSVSSIRSTDAVLLENMQVTAQIASQNISSNLHLLADRIYNLASNRILSNPSETTSSRQDFLADASTKTEFVWLAAYDTTGQKMYGDSLSPSSLSDTHFFQDLTETANTTIGEPGNYDNTLQLYVGSPIFQSEELLGYVVGSYKYDMLNDVLSMLILGDTGTASILNEEGIIIGDRDTSVIKNSVSIYDLYGSSKNNEIYDKILAHETGSVIMSLHHKQHYVGYTPIPGTNWVLIIDAPRIEFMNSVLSSIFVAILLGIILLGIAAAAIIPIAQRISMSLSTSTHRLQALAEGNLTDEVLVSDDIAETRILTEALSKTIRRLNSYIVDIQSSLGALSSGDYTIEVPNTFCGDFTSIRDALCNITDALNETMEKMNQSSMEANNNSLEVSDYAKQLHSGSLEQARVLEQLEESMTDITSSIERNRDNVSQIEQYSEEAKVKTAQGDNYMQSMLETMEQINKAVEEISHISQLIEDISNQTNLLSLNASIEAARAGEAGRSFAVVATEIGHLSGQTTDALKQTSDIITHSTETIQEGLKTAGHTAEAFRAIREVTDQYLQISTQLSDTVLEQTNAVSSVNEHLTSLSGIAEDNKHLAEETDRMAGASLAQSESLRDYVAQVKIREIN